MRGISASAVMVFILAILLIELLAYLGIIQLVSGKRLRQIVSAIYWTATAAFLFVWMSAFLDPDKIRQTTSYDFFYFVISLSVLNLVPKALLALVTLFSFFSRFLLTTIFAKRILLAGVIISLGILLSTAYGIALGKKTLQINRIELTLDDLPAKLDGLKVVQISDLHLGSFRNDHFLQEIAIKINGLNPDILVFTGDMVNNYYQEMIGFDDALSSMDASFGKFAIWGNHDYGDYSNWKNTADKIENHKRVAKKIRDAGFLLLQNKSAKVSLRDTSLYLIGVENWGHKPFPQYAELDSALQNVPEPSFKILLSHDPNHWEDEVVPKTALPLTLSGHTHGGQFGVKIGGITFSPMYFIQPLWAGLYKQDGQYLYVNQGTGCVGFPGRIDMNPEITLLTLRSNRAKADRKQ